MDAAALLGAVGATKWTQARVDAWAATARAQQCGPLRDLLHAHLPNLSRHERLIDLLPLTLGILVALFALALASAGMSVRLYIVPCEKKTSYETTNTTTVVNLTSYENVTVLENVRSRRGTPTRLPTPSTRRRRIGTRKRDGARAKTQHPDAGYDD